LNLFVIFILEAKKIFKQIKLSRQSHVASITLIERPVETSFSPKSNLNIPETVAIFSIPETASRSWKQLRDVPRDFNVRGSAERREHATIGTLFNRDPIS
jgi:hypothetical protein